MTTLVSNFEGGTSGTTVTTGNSGGISGNAFDAVNIGAGGVCAYSNTYAAHGQLSCQVSTISNAVACGWNTSIGTPTQIWFRIYLYFTAAPTAADTRFFTVTNTGGTGQARFSISASSKFETLNNTGIVINATTNSVPVNKWIRVEGMAIMSATVGQTQLSVYLDGADAATPTETITSAATQNTLSGTLQSYLFGPGSGTVNVGPYWIDDIGVSTTGYLGPVVLYEPALVTAAQGPNTLVNAVTGAYVAAATVVTNTGSVLYPGVSGAIANGKLLTGGVNETSVMSVQPGMNVRPLVLVDATGNFI
jgi:hypothetical protein